jgi:hypothetical protein
MPGITQQDSIETATQATTGVEDYLTTAAA